jgi:rod shape-determining protein MreC
MLNDFLQRHKAGFLLLCFTGFSLLCMSLQVTPYVTGIKTTVWFLFSPEIVYSGRFFNKLDSLKGRLFHLIRVEGENVILRAQNAQLSKTELERDALLHENDRLRTLLDLQKKFFSRGISAEILGRDPRTWFQSVTINKGSTHGIALSAAVVAPSGSQLVLVGRVVEANATTSKVLLLTDGGSSISASLPRTNDIGLLEGRNKPWVSLNFLPEDSEVTSGDQVLTAGMGGLFPAALPVGQVLSVGESPDGFFKEARIKPYANISSLREVLVINRENMDDPS